MHQTPIIPLALVSCVAFALAACDQKSSTTNDPARDRQFQELQSKIDSLSSRSDELSRELANREAADAAAKRAQLEKDQAEINREKAQLEADREALAKTGPVPENTASDQPISPNDDEPVYEGKPAGRDLFYTRLQDDGDWIESGEYGYIWQPAVAVRNPRWRPYSDGRWVDTDRGWAWDSNERFGWATYHYGRWVNLHSSGWCWVPGDEWAPAWVSWRSGERYVGWAPLPPEARLQRGGSISASVDFGTGPSFFNFVDTEYFGEPSYVGRLIEPEQNVTIIYETVNVTNIIRNNTVIRNYGPDYDKISRRSRRRVERCQLDLERDPKNFDGKHSRGEGNRLAFAAPIIANAVSASDRPEKVVKKIVKADRDNGWRGIGDDQALAVKAGLDRRTDQKTQREQVQRERVQSEKVVGDPSNDSGRKTRQPDASAKAPSRAPENVSKAPPQLDQQSQSNGIVGSRPTDAPKPTGVTPPAGDSRVINAEAPRQSGKKMDERKTREMDNARLEQQVAAQRQEAQRAGLEKEKADRRQQAEVFLQNQKIQEERRDAERRQQAQAMRQKEAQEQEAAMRRVAERQQKPDLEKLKQRVPPQSQATEAAPAGVEGAKQSQNSEGVAEEKKSERKRKKAAE